MSHTPSNDDRLEELLIRMIDGELTDDELAALTDRLEHDRAARDLYRELVRDHAILRWQYGAPQPAIEMHDAPPSADVSPASLPVRRALGGRTHGTLYRYAAAAVLLIVAGLAAAYLLAPRRDVEPPARVATLVNAENAVFAGGHAAAEVGDALMSGPIELASGRAQVLFDSTAVADLDGACEFELTGPNRGRLTRGLVHIFVPERAHGFTVDLPGNVHVTDLGTRLSIQVAGPTHTNYVVVQEGRVSVSNPGKGQDVLVTAGQVCACEPNGALRVIETPTDADVVANGGFEAASPDATWSIVGNAFVMADIPTPVRQDRNVLVFNAGDSVPNGVVTQELHTLPAVRYRLRLRAAKYGGVEGNVILGIDAVDVASGLSVASETHNVAPKAGSTPDAFETVTFDFTARGDRTLLKLSDRCDSPGINFDLVIDQVEVKPVAGGGGTENK
ncbi:MAG: hypothetical protein GC159_06465 [Phycisphaera sp.]|nr:hypothetical protein [Phycisphaera sp.]